MRGFYLTACHVLFKTGHVLKVASHSRRQQGEFVERWSGPRPLPTFICLAVSVCNVPVSRLSLGNQAERQLSNSTNAYSVPFADLASLW